MFGDFWKPETRNTFRSIWKLRCFEGPERAGRVLDMEFSIQSTSATNAAALWIYLGVSGIIAQDFSATRRQKKASACYLGRKCSCANISGIERLMVSRNMPAVWTWFQIRVAISVVDNPVSKGRVDTHTKPKAVVRPAADACQLSARW